jgi:putative hydrolase of the HAD superfamily
VTSRSPRVLLLDLGNVVAFFDHQRACRALSDLSAPPRTAAEMHGAIFGSGLEQDFDRGRLRAAEFVERLRGWCPGASDQALAAAWGNIFRPNPTVLGALPRLKQAGLRIVLASNTNELHYAWLQHRLPEALALMDATALSFQIGETKPAPAFFDACLRLAGADAAACFFIDDKPEYVAAARRLGIDGLLYSDHAFASWVEGVAGA